MAKHAAPQSGQVALFGLFGGAPKRTLDGRAMLLGALGLVAVLLLALALWLASGRAGAWLQPDFNAQRGSLNATAVDVPEGSFQLVLNQTPTVQAGSRSLNVEFENPAANAYAGTLTLRLADGRTLGTTPAVQPGYYVKCVELQEDLAAGAYAATADVVLTQDGQEVGRSSAAVEVRVG